MRRFLRNNGLSLVLFLLFLGTWAIQFEAGRRAHNEERQPHGLPELGPAEYVKSGHFWQATAENWESEFLQMAMFVILTCCLFQKGSPESKDPDEANDPVDEDPRDHRDDPRAPWPVRRGNDFLLWLYSNSLSICFAALFLFSFWLHARHGVRDHNEDAIVHGEPQVTTLQFMGTSQFWFESMQNWQSEFLSLVAMVYLSVYLRQHGSAESKPVATPHHDHGD
jgi:cbb3-type cytochrome oxidase subunit 3